MQAQFATFEAVAAAYAILFAIAFASTAIAGYASSQYSSLNRLRLSFAIHDFIAAAQANSSLDSCLASYIQNKSDCMGYYAYYYSRLYGLSGFNLSTPANYTAGENCFPVLNSTQLICFGD